MKVLLQVCAYDNIKLKLLLLFLFDNNLINGAFIFNNLNIIYVYKNKLVKDNFYVAFLILENKDKGATSLYIKKNFGIDVLILSLL